jgi:hypothetical protein
LNVAARGLAEHRPEPAAVLQGTVNALMRRLVPAAGTPTPADVTPQPGSFGQMITTARRDTTQILIAALGEPRMRELRARGAAMDEDQAYTYARTHIDEYLATIDEAQDD